MKGSRLSDTTFKIGFEDVRVIKCAACKCEEQSEGASFD